MNGIDAGHGVLGMRERAALLGGTLVVGPVAGGFRVLVRLPYPAGEGVAPAVPNEDGG